MAEKSFYGHCAAGKSLFRETGQNRKEAGNSSEVSMREPDACELCRRSGLRLTKHHLIPRTRHKNKQNKRLFTRREVKERIAMLCIACHKHVHTLLTEKELEREFNTIVALLAHPGIARFVAWIESKPPGFKPRR